MPLNDENYRLTIPVVKGRCARDVLSHTFNIGVYKTTKKNITTIQHISNESANIIVMLLLTPIITRNPHKECQWLTRKLWRHTLAFVINEITSRRAYVAYLSPLIWKIWCHFPPKCTQSCYDRGFDNDLPCYVEIMARVTGVDDNQDRRPMALSWLRP